MKRRRSIALDIFHFATAGLFDESAEERLRRETAEAAERLRRETAEAAERLRWDTTLAAERLRRETAEAVQHAFHASGQRAADVRALIARGPMKAGVAIPPVAVEGETMLSSSLGFFDLPAIDGEFLMGPKGFDLTNATRVLVEPQRLELVAKFLQAMEQNTQCHRSSGVLLSGPAGAGKTAVGLLAFMYCVARNKLCVYIPDAGEWVKAAKADGGDNFFLTELLRQNADLIRDSPVLYSALAPALAGGPLDATVMNRLLGSLRARPGPAIGCIVDEVQKISAAVAAGQMFGAVAKEREASVYFQHWQEWTTCYKWLVRMDIASANGSREFTLPRGEDDRLRILRPLPPAEIESLCSSDASPLYIETPALRARTVFIGGGILRLLYQVRNGLSCKMSLDVIEHSVRTPMLEHCQRWFAKLSDIDRLASSRAMLALLRGEVHWDRVKGLYDSGIVARNSVLTTFVEPVSSVAASVIVQVLSTYGRAHCTSLMSFAEGEQRGFELERQLIEFLFLSNRLLAAKCLDASFAPAVPARADVALPLRSISGDLRSSTVASLFIPLSKQYSCDAITVPAISDAKTAAVVLWESSVTDPRDPKRVSKIVSWFSPEGVVEQVRAVFPTHPIVCALCWDGELAPGKHKAFLNLDKAARAAISTTVVVIGGASLRTLGVLA